MRPGFGASVALCLTFVCLTLGVAGAQSGVDGMKPLKVTPQLRQELNRYAMQVAKRTCSDELRAGYVPVALTPAQFDQRFPTMVEAIKRQSLLRDPASTVVSNSQPGVSGYILMTSAKYSTAVLAIVARQTVNNQAALVRYSCVLK